jgi:hypothetical protein
MEISVMATKPLVRIIIIIIIIKQYIQERITMITNAITLMLMGKCFSLFNHQCPAVAVIFNTHTGSHAHAHTP